MNYHNITHDDMLNGSGLRVCLWTSGCTHQCANCQNPQTWDKNSGIQFDIDAEKELFHELSKNYISGITYTGGDPLHENNVKTLLDLTKKIKENFPNKNIWIYTGYTFEQIMFPYCTNEDKDIASIRKELIGLCDVLVDGEYVEELRDVSLKWKGSSNQRVIDIRKTTNNQSIVLYS